MGRMCLSRRKAMVDCNLQHTNSHIIDNEFAARHQEKF